MNRYKLPLSVTHPELAAEAVGWDTSKFTASSAKKVKWQCKHGHIWDAAIHNRCQGKGCPFCSNKKILIGYNDLLTTHPEIAAEAYGWDPTTTTFGSNKKFNWRCPIGHIWISSVHSRRGKGCAVCTGKQIIIGVNDLETVNPILAAEADGWDPKKVTAYSGKKVKWKCKKGHNWVTAVSNRSGGSGCLICSGHRVSAGHNDLATTNPKLALEANGWDTSMLSAGSSKKVSWKCKQGHTWVAPVSARSSGHGCPFCSNRQVLVGYNDLATTNPKLAAEAFNWDSTKLTGGSHEKVNWKCEYGHIWVAAVEKRNSGGGCPFCSRHKVLTGYNDLATINPELAAQADGWDATKISSRSGKKVSWRCKNNHTWLAAVCHRSGGYGCPTCSNQRVLAGYNDLATTNPELAAQADDWDPTTLTAHSGIKVGWKCEQGHQWRTRVTNRSRGGGCPTCAQKCFDPNQKGWLYLIENDELDMFKIGISNFPKQRIIKHQRRGWGVIEVRGPMEGYLARQLETVILHAVEHRGAVLGHKAEIEKFDGYSEAWTKDSLSVTSFKQLLDWVYEDDKK